MVNCTSKRDTTFEIFIKRYQKYVFSAAINISRKKLLLSSLTIYNPMICYGKLLAINHFTITVLLYYVI